MYLGHLKLCAMYINGRKYVCCSECDVVSNECDEPTPLTCATYRCPRSFSFRGELGFLNCDDICVL